MPVPAESSIDRVVDWPSSNTVLDAVGLLAALATLTGAIGSGMGILLTVGIIYMLYQQLEKEGLYQTYPILEKIAK